MSKIEFKKEDLVVDARMISAVRINMGRGMAKRNFKNMARKAVLARLKKERKAPSFIAYQQALSDHFVDLIWDYLLINPKAKEKDSHEVSKEINEAIHE